MKMKTRLLFVFLLTGTMALAWAHKFAYPLDSVTQALEDRKIEAIAAETEDAEIVFGLACLANPDSPVRPRLFERVRSMEPSLAPATHIWNFLLQEVSRSQAEAILQSDPNNALGYYLLGKFDYDEDREVEALKMFRKGRACEAIRLYQSQAGEAIIKALDHMGFEGRERLCALSSLADELISFGSGYFQYFPRDLTGMALDEGLERKEEIADLLVILAGQMWVVNDYAQYFAHQSLSQGFRLKAEAAAVQRSPKMNGYAAVTQALVSVDFRNYRYWYDAVLSEPEVVRNLPNSLSNALRILENLEYDASKLDLSPEHQVAHENAWKKNLRASRELIALAEKNPDEILKPYLFGLAENPNYSEGPWVANRTAMDQLVKSHTELFEQAIAYDESRQAMHDAAKSDPSSRNMRRMMKVGLQSIIYADNHKNRLPGSLDDLFDAGLLTPEEARSIFTDELYVYLGDGRERPRKRADDFMLLYDAHRIDGKIVQVVFADGHGEWMNVERFEKRLEEVQADTRKEK